MFQKSFNAFLLFISFGLSIGYSFLLPNDSEASSRTAKVDPLSIGPLSLTPKELEDTNQSLAEAFLYRDKDCHLSLENQRLTYLDPADVPAVESLCEKRDKLIVYTPKHSTLVACVGGQVAWTAKAAIGSKGLGKKKEGDRKTPVGTYWLGYPRKSNLFGIFIPVGYPNKEELKLGYTGYAIGIHGPMRIFTCLPKKGLEKNWTAGCLAVARDEQILNISSWVLENWPVQLEVRAK